ncbi:hypothetical protein LWI28_019428 [Acer negundo]|uniref:Uncharacterized protein n=1 Tax=Acer negundo TaxID=4023 RepID=A0AAD5JLR8_ACENE|nr:hypothetical protein LWI28_019428 [Acer negundo]
MTAKIPSMVDTKVALNEASPSFASHVSRVSPQEGNYGLVLLSSTNNTWVIDSGATDHMTSNVSLITSLMSSPIKSIQDNLTKKTIGTGSRGLESESSRRLQLCEQVSYFSGDVSLVPLKGEISSKEEERLWLEEKRVWITSKGEDSTILGEGESLDAPDLVYVESSDSERPTRLKDSTILGEKDVTLVPPLDSSTPLNDTIMPSDDSSAIELEVQTSPKVHNYSPIIPASNVILDSNPTDLENTTGKRYPLRDRK